MSNSDGDKDHFYAHVTTLVAFDKRSDLFCLIKPSDHVFAFLFPREDENENNDDSIDYILIY